jgi:hypothetical protein
MNAISRNSIILIVSTIVASIIGMSSATAQPLPVDVFKSPLLPDPVDSFRSPLPPPSFLLGGDGGSNTIFLPIIMRNYDGYTGPVTPRYGPVCSNDPARGQLYRDLVGFTVSFLQPLFDWTSVSCLCGLSTAQAAGTVFGAIAGRIVRIIVEIFNLLFEAIGSVVSLIGSLFALISGAATPPAISCEGDAEGICLGLAAIVALDDMADGIITLMVLVLLTVLSFYLGMYHIREVRSIMQPETGGDDE